MASAPRRFARRALSDAVNLFLLPAVLALLPWPFAFRAIRYVARVAAPFRPEADAACAAAAGMIPIEDPAAWKHGYRLVRWVERVDTYLVLFRSRRWWLRRVEFDGAWPPRNRPGLFLTYHWGAGQWIWKVLHDAGFDAYFVARRPQATDLGVSRVALSYGRLREWGFRHLGGLGVIYTGGSRRRIADALNAGCSIVGMLDLPGAASDPSPAVDLLGHAVRFPDGLIECADGTCRVAIFSCALDLRTGRRRLRLRTLPEGARAAAVMRQYAYDLEACLRESPESWLMWHEVQAMRVASDPVMPDPS